MNKPNILFVSHLNGKDCLYLDDTFYCYVNGFHYAPNRTTISEAYIHKKLGTLPIKIHTTTSVLCYDMSKQSLKELIDKMLSLKIK